MGGWDLQGEWVGFNTELKAARSQQWFYIENVHFAGILSKNNVSLK